MLHAPTSSPENDPYQRGFGCRISPRPRCSCSPVAQHTPSWWVLHTPVECATPPPGRCALPPFQTIGKQCDVAKHSNPPQGNFSAHVWGLHSQLLPTPLLTKNPAFCGTGLSTLLCGKSAWQLKRLRVYVVYRSRNLTQFSKLHCIILS